MSARPAIVGGFILGALGVAVAAILLFGGARIFNKTLLVVVYFSESVAGLTVGAPVTFHGVQIGSVESVTVQFFAENATARIPVVLRLDPNEITWEGVRPTGDRAEYDRLVKAGLRAQLALQSLVTGQLRVDLDFVRDAPLRLVGTDTDLPEIPAVPSQLSQLQEQLSRLPLRSLIDSALRALASIERLANHADVQLDPLAESARRVADNATQSLQTTSEAVKQVREEAVVALRDLDTLLIDAHRQLDARGGEVSRTLTTADTALRRAQTLLDSLNSLTEPRSQFRGELEAAARDLAATASSLRGFAEAVERNPNALLLGRKGGP